MKSFVWELPVLLPRLVFISNTVPQKRQHLWLMQNIISSEVPFHMFIKCIKSWKHQICHFFMSKGFKVMKQFCFITMPLSGRCVSFCVFCFYNTLNTLCFFSFSKKPQRSNCIKKIRNKATIYLEAFQMAGSFCKPDKTLISAHPGHAC